MVSKPIHQFDIDSPTDKLGGSLFVFCQGAEPELILSIEARKQDSAFEWFYSAASLTDFGLTLWLDDNAV